MISHNLKSDALKPVLQVPHSLETIASLLINTLVILKFLPVQGMFLLIELSAARATILFLTANVCFAEGRSSIMASLVAQMITIQTLASKYPIVCLFLLEIVQPSLFLLCSKFAALDLKCIIWLLDNVQTLQVSIATVLFRYAVGVLKDQNILMVDMNV